jgi:hypothetical protein
MTTRATENQHAATGPGARMRSADNPTGVDGTRSTERRTRPLRRWSVAELLARAHTPSS